MCGCSDDELVEYRRAGGEWRLDAVSNHDEQDRVTRALSSLRAMHEARHERGVVNTLETIVRERHVRAICASLRHGREALRRVDFVLDQARAFVEAGGSSITELLEWMTLQAERETRLVEEPGDDGSHDAIRILTIHGAKGLEFPIVALGELGAPMAARSNGPGCSGETVAGQRSHPEPV